MTSRKRNHTDYHFKITEKSQVCVVHFQDLVGESFVYLFFLIAKDLKTEWRSFKMSADGDVRNLPTQHTEWKMNTTSSSSYFDSVCFRQCRRHFYTHSLLILIIMVN